MPLIDELFGLARAYPYAALIVGFAMLMWSADRFVNAAAATARNLGVSKIVIGLTAIAVGTSAPEIMVGINDCLRERDPGLLAIGNAIGSNICNIGLVLGVTAIVCPLPFAASVLKRELPWLMGATVLALLCLFGLHLGWLDGLALLAGLAYILYGLATATGEGIAESMQSDVDEMPDMSMLKSVVWFFIGLVVLLLSAKALVQAAEEIAIRFEVSKLVIGLTVIAVGTSLPELAVTVRAALGGHADLAIGNVVGSNILNILAVLAIPALMAPQDIGVLVLWRDYGMMLALTALLILFAYGIGSRKVITRFEGVILVAAWVGYMYVTYHHEQQIVVS